MDQCCDNPREIVTKESVICGNCDSLLDDISFEDTLYLGGNRKSNTRVNKFFKVIVEYDLPWYVRHEMLDLFPMVESYFYESTRINFINMHQLTIEMCRVLGYDECILGMTSLKTKSRVKQIRGFVRSACDMMPQSCVPLTRLRDISLIPLHSNRDLDMSKVYSSNHVYSNIDPYAKNKDNKLCPETPTSKVKVVLRRL